MMDAHHTRAHAVWSASATARNCVCPGAIAMSSLCEDVEREAAAWGTCAHQIAEKCLRGRLDDAAAAIGTTEKSGKFEFVVDEEMANCAQVYVDYVREKSDGHRFWIEQHFSLASLDPPLEAGGTGDAVIYNANEKSLEIVDLKGGRGVTVDVKGNPQGRSYAIGALLAFPELDVKTIRVTIVQPRVGDGKPKSDEFHVADLMDWTHDLLQHMTRAKQALDEFEVIDLEQREVRRVGGALADAGPMHVLHGQADLPGAAQEGACRHAGAGAQVARRHDTGHAAGAVQSREAGLVGRTGARSRRLRRSGGVDLRSARLCTSAKLKPALRSPATSWPRRSEIGSGSMTSKRPKR